MKPLLALAILAAVAGLVRLVRDAREWATWDRDTPETDDGLFVPMAAYLPGTLSITTDGNVTVREAWRN